MVVLVATVISQSNNRLEHPGTDLLAVLFAFAALVTGVYAQATQLRHWSRRVKRKLFVGLPAAFCTLLVAIANLLDRHAPAAANTPERPVAVSPNRSTPEDNNLIKPGWYGELLADGALLVITSYQEDAAESRSFNRGLLKPVSYATLSIINIGNSIPVSLTSPQVTLHLENGETVQSLTVQELLSPGNEQKEALRKRLAKQAEAPLGGMLPDIPICVDAPFDWSRVAGVAVQIGAHTVTVPGRTMSVQEKSALLPNSTRPSSPKHDSRIAEDWYKNL